MESLIKESNYILHRNQCIKLPVSVHMIILILSALTMISLMTIRTILAHTVILNPLLKIQAVLVQNQIWMLSLDIFDKLKRQPQETIIICTIRAKRGKERIGSLR